MRSLITGASGQVGYALILELKKRGLNNLLAPSHTEMDITDQDQVLNTITSFHPDIIFHCAAYTNVEKAEDEAKELCMRTNAEGTKHIVNAAAKTDAKLIYLSTECVFDGTKKGTYGVNDTTNPLNIYGKSKLIGENAVKNYQKHFIVRTNWVFGIGGDNFVQRVLRLSQTHNQLTMVHNKFSSPTSAKDLAKLLVDMGQTSKYGTYHAVNEGYVSRYDYAAAILKECHINIQLNRCLASEFPSKAQMPLNAKFDTISLKQNGFDLLPPWQDALKEYCKELR